jgi:hypothetical protein
VAYVQDSLTRRDVTSSAAPKNNGVKTHKDALSASCTPLPRNPQLSAGFMIDSNLMIQVSTTPGSLKNGNGVAVAADDRFTTVRRTTAKKETSSNLSVSLKKNKQPVIGVRNSSYLRTIVKRIKIKSLFVSRFPLRFQQQILKNHYWRK